MPLALTDEQLDAILLGARPLRLLSAIATIF